MDSYDNFDLIGDENLMQDAFKFGDLDADPGCCFSTRDGDWDPFSASGSGTHTSTTNDASIWSEELLNSIVGAEMVIGSDITNQLEEREAQVGPSEDNFGSFKSVMVIEGDKPCLLSKGVSQAEIIMCNSESPGVEMVIGGENNAQTHEVEREMGPIEFISENFGGKMVTKVEFVIETSDVEADSGCTLHEPGPLGDCSPETESVINKIVGSGLMKMSNETEEVEKGITEEKPTECNSENLRCEVVIGCSDNTLDERKFHVGPTKSNTVNLGGEMVIEGVRNIELGEGECYMGCTGKTLKSQIVTEGGRNCRSNERESHVGAIVDVSENLLDETLVKRGTEDQSKLVDRQVGPASPSCENLFGDAEEVTRGDINNKWDEGACQAGPAELLCSSQNESNELKECIGTSTSSHLIQESTYDVHEVPPGERNTQEEETTTAVSHSEKRFEQIGPSELYKSVDEKNCTGSRLELPFMETGGKEERMKSELCGRVLSISPGFSLRETSVVKLLDVGPLSSSFPATYLTNDKPVCAPTMSARSLDNKLVAPLCVATAPFSDFSSIAANIGGHPMENITKIKEAEKRSTEEYGSADCGDHTPVELTTGGCSSPIELTEEPTFEAASVEKHDENEEVLNESVLIHSNCKVENTGLYKNLESNLDQRINRDDTSRFLATNLAHENPAVVEAVPESPAGIGNTEGFHDPSDDSMTTGELQTIQPIQVNCVESDSMEQSTKENLVTSENSISVHEMPSSVTELVCQSDSPSEVIKETTATETVPDTELHGPRDCMRDPMDVSPVIQSVEVKAVEPLDRTMDEEANVNDKVSENSVMNDVTVEDIVPEPSPVKLLSEPHADASSDDGTQEIDNDRISPVGCMQKDDEETNDKDVSGIAGMLNAIVKDVGLTLSPVKISSEHHADAGTIDSTLVRSDAVEQDADDGVLSVHPLMEKITEENSAVNDPTELELSVTVDDVGPWLSSVKTSFEFNRDTSSIDGAPIPLENKMEDGEFSGNILSEKSTEDNDKNSLTMEDVELSFSPVKITPASDMDASPIDHVLETPEDEIKNVKVSDGCLDENRSEDKSEVSEITNDTRIEDLVKISSKTNDEITPVDFVPIQSDDVIDDGNGSGDLGVVQSSGFEREYLGAMNQRSEATIGSLLKGMRLECESTPVDKQGGVHVGAISTDCAPIQSDIAVSLSHIEGEDLKAKNQTDTTAISFGEEMETRSKLTSQEMAELVEGMRPKCESTPVDKQGGVHVGAISTDCVPIQSDIAVSLSHIEGEDLEATNQTDTTVISFGEEMETRSKSTSQEMSELVEGMRPECESTPVDKQGGVHVAAISTDCGPIQSDIAVSLSHIEVEDLEATNQTDMTVISFGEEMETRNKSTSQEMAELVEGMRPECESTPVDKQGGVHVGDISIDCAPLQSDIAVSLSHIEVEDLEATNQIDTTVISFGEEMETRSKSTSQEMAELVEGMRPKCESTPVDKQGGVHVGAISIDCGPIQSDIAVSLSHIEVEDLEATNQIDTTVISFGEEMETRRKSISQEMAELVEGMRPECESTPVDKQGVVHVGDISTDCGPIQSDIAVSLSHIEVEDLEATNQNTTVISFGEEMETRSKSTSEEMAELVEGMRPECESTPVDKQGGVHVGAISTDCVPIQSDIAVSLSHIEGEDLEATNQTDTTVISFGEEMETRSKSTSQEMSDLVEAENKTTEPSDVSQMSYKVIGASLEIAEASSADKLSQNSEIGDDASAPQLDDVLQCTLTENKDPKPGLLEFGNGEKTCSTSECSLPEENVTGVSLGDLCPNVKLGTMKEPQVKFNVPEKMRREDENNFESPSVCASGTVVDEKTEDLKKRYSVSGSNIHSPSTSKAVMLNEAVNNRTCVEKNAKLPDLNMPQSATAPSQESVTEAQKMQLRAQICVYGCLVDGSLLIEAYMARSFEESERCIWEPIWHAYSETLKNRSPLSSGKTPTLSGSQRKKTATRTIQNDTSFISPYLYWSPVLSSNFQSSSWHFSPQSRGKEPLRPIRVRVESEKPSRRKKRSFKDKVCSPSQNYLGRNANLIAAATNNVTPDFIVQTLPVPVSPVLTYAPHSKKEKAGLVQVASCTHGSIVQSRPTSEDLINKVVPGCSLVKEPNIEPICSLNRDRSVLSCAALPVFQLQSPSGYYQIAPPAPSCALVGESSRQAEELSAKASEILDHSPGLQETVTTDKSSSTDPQNEVATAVAAAESVTKAAAAAKLASEAARLASEVALQSKLLADEAMSLMDSNPGMDLSMFQAGMELEMVTPAKVLKSKDKVHGSHTFVSAMREASRRRVKLASAASRRAENMDTILRAAEMAAEAVSQVGLVLTMGDPLPFSIADMVDTIGRDHLRAVQSRAADVSRREKAVDMGIATHDRTMAAQAGEALMRDPVPISFGQRELTGPGEDISIEIGGNVIKKGSHVEVTGEKEGLIGVWFGAIVLDLKDGMAHIRYTDLPSCKEKWVPVERESGAAPMVRLAHPVTALKHDGNRKRRRENVSSYSWSVGDHVDAWMRDGWWECIIAKKHDDEAKYTVHFPVQGESLVVGEWDLRPSLVWKSGSWVEWVRVKESSEFSKGDSPLKKRQRVCSTPHDAEIVMPKPNPSKSTKIPKPLHRYAREITSLISGTNRKREESDSEPKRTGPRVCFGVPRPNKKTKILEVAQVSRPRLSNNSTLVPNSNRREKWQKPLTKIPEPSKGPDDNLTKLRGKKPMTEPVTRKRVFSSTMLGGQNGTCRKGVLTVGTGTSDRAGKTDAGSTEPRRSGRKVKPTSRILEGLATDSLMSKIPGAGSIKGSFSLKGPTRQ